MLRRYSRRIMSRIHERFKTLYGDRADKCMERLDMAIGRYGVGMGISRPSMAPNERDVVLITYGDMVTDEGERPLTTLKTFLDRRGDHAINTVHILPFFPWSSDDGFSVIDYREVDRDLGQWKDIEALSENYTVMADLVLNHVSRKSDWFREYVMGTAPARDYFVEADPEEPDLSRVVRPRSLPLLTRTRTRDGIRHVWTTFSSDQVDLNFENPDVLFEFIDILLFFRSQGIRVIRMDAIAYLWKEIGTDCIHHPMTHEVVKLFRDLMDMILPDMILLTETNVPHEENVSYFGDGDEAHMVYQFSLPPLVLHALLTGNAAFLAQWAEDLEDPPPGCTFLNFTSSHDGIGVRPLQGLVPDGDLEELVEAVRQRGGEVSMKSNADGTESPYELNITYLSALTDPGETVPGPTSIDRFVCSQAIELAFKGIPAIYFNNLVGGLNNHEGAKETGRARTLNRGKWNWPDLNERLDDESSHQARIYRRLIHLLHVRAGEEAFHPESEQTIHRVSDKVLIIEREAVVCLNNVTDETVQLDAAFLKSGTYRDLISGRELEIQQQLSLKPYETLWLREQISP